MRTLWWIGRPLLIVAASSLGSPAQDVGASSKADDPSQAPVATVFPSMPPVRLAPMAGFAQDAAYIQSIADRAAGIIERAGATERAADRVELWLSAANLILAYQLEPACTKRILGITGHPEGQDVEAVGAVLDRAEGLIARADEALGDIDAADDTVKEHAARQRQQSGMLRAFASVLRAFLLPSTGADPSRESRHAASALAPLREDPDPRVAAAASFWQACLRAREADPGPALAVLDPALADPRHESMPYAFFGRLLRCRLLAEQGSVAMALALLLQMEERTEDWLRTDTDRADAVRAIRLARLQTLARWFDRLSASDVQTERQWCADRAAVLIETTFQGDADTLLRMSPAIPVTAPTGEPVPTRGPSVPPAPDDDP